MKPKRHFMLTHAITADPLEVYYRYLPMQK